MTPETPAQPDTPTVQTDPWAVLEQEVKRPGMAWITLVSAFAMCRADVERQHAAEVEQLKCELRRWQVCANCGENLSEPGICDKAVGEKQEGLESMCQQALDMRDKAQAQAARLRAALEAYRAHHRNYGECRSTEVSCQMCLAAEAALAVARAALRPERKPGV